MKLAETAKGVYIISVTPFHEDGAVDLKGTPLLVEFYLERGVQGLTILGMMGEAPKLTASEALAFTRTVISSAAGRVPVVAGVSGSGFAAMGELARAVMDAGCAGVMVAPITGLRTDDAIVSYFHTVAETLGDIPFVLQDFPQANGVFMSTAVIARIISEIPSCVMLKHEDWPGLEKITAVRAKASRHISILTGNGGVFLPEEMRRGADGAMTGFAFPEMMVDVIAAHTSGQHERASDLFDAYLPLARYEQQPGLGLAVRKFVLARRGAIASDTQRRPAISLSPQARDEVEFLLARQTRRLLALG